MGAVVAGAGPAHALYFATYEYSKDVSQKLFPNHQSLAIGMLHAATVVPISHSLLIHNRFSLPPRGSLFCRHRHTDPRRHLQSDGGDQAAPTNVPLSVQVDYAVRTRRVRIGGPARLLSVVQHAADHEPALPDHTLCHVRVHPEYGNKWLPFPI